MLRIEAKNFRSYSDISWTLPEGLTLIDGENRDTGGSNMAGKTTLLDAWFWARYGWLPKWGGPKGGPVDAVIRRGEKSCSVKITETFGPTEIAIKRERPNKLTVWKDGVEQKSMDQAQLEQLLGMSALRFLICVYIPQKRKQSFYHMGDKERTEMLSIIAGLEDLDRGLQDGKIRRDNAKTLVERLDGARLVYEAQLNELPLRREELKHAVATAEDNRFWSKRVLDDAKAVLEAETQAADTERERIFEQDTSDIRKQSSALAQDINVLTIQYREKEEELKKTPQVESEIVSAVVQAREALEKGKKLKEQCDQIEKTNQRLQDKIAQEEANAEGSRHGKCPTCTQPLPDWDINAKVERHLAKAEEYRSQIKEVPERPNLDLLERQLESANNAYTKRKAELDAYPSQLSSAMQALRAEIASKTSQMKALESEVNRIRQEIQAKMDKKLEAFRKDVYAAEADYSTAKAVLENAEKNLQQFEQEEGKLQQLLANTLQQLSDQRKELDLALDLIDLCGPKGYRAVCFDGLVNRIGDRAGELLQLMTDGLYSTRLEQIGTDSKGNQKLILKPIVMKGSQEVPLDDLSGGAEDRIALAYDVAVSEAAGDGLPLLLDEVLKGIDEVGKAEAMILLEEVSKTRPVLVIDHTSEFKAMFNKVLKIVYENEESRIETAQLEPSTYNEGHG